MFEMRSLGYGEISIKQLIIDRRMAFKKLKWSEDDSKIANRF